MKNERTNDTTNETTTSRADEIAKGICSFLEDLPARDNSRELLSDCFLPRCAREEQSQTAEGEREAEEGHETNHPTTDCHCKSIFNFFW
jgi:hypothetical protein